MRSLLASAGVLALMAIAGCGAGDDESDNAGGSATETGAAPAPQRDGTTNEAGTGITIKAADNSDLGTILFDGKDGPVYLFDKETSDRSECYGDCARAWPPVVTDGSPRAGRGAQAAKLGTTQRRDGTMQVTYAGHPLYYYEGDSPGEVRCNDVEEFGGLWLVLDPSGKTVQ
jgi:predicted lipoprotein with Yx(FWY)xxD motif